LKKELQKPLNINKTLHNAKNKNGEFWKTQYTSVWKGEYLKNSQNKKVISGYRVNFLRNLPEAYTNACEGSEEKELILCEVFSVDFGINSTKRRV